MSIKIFIALIVIAIAFIGTTRSSGAAPSLLGKRVQFYSQIKHKYTKLFMKHRGFKVVLERRPYSWHKLQFDLDSSFDVVPGLSGIGISLRSVNYPNYFIRHRGYVARLGRYKNSNRFKEDASFIPRKGLANSRCVSFETINCPGQYLIKVSSRRKFIVKIARIHGTWNSFYKPATWCPRIVKNVVVNGEWSLLYANDNAAANGEYTIRIEEGVTVGTTSSMTRSVENSWRAGVESETSGKIFGIGFSLKKMFETSGRVGVSRTRSSSWAKSSVISKGYKATLVKGNPFFLWQWIVHALTADSAYITSKTDIYKQTTSNTPPAPIRSR